MNYEIKRGAAVIATVRPEGKETSKIMGEALVNMTFKLSSKITFLTNDKVLVYGNWYFLVSEPTLVKINSTEFHYTLQFTSIKYELAKALFFFPDADDNLTVSEFSITGTAETIIDLIVQNANRDQIGWTKGVVDATETKTIDFNAHNCLTALAKIAEEFEIEYWVDGDQTIHITERNEASGYTLEYGKTKGLKSLSRAPFNDSNIVTRLYAKGSTDNIPKDYRNYSKNLKMPVAYLEKNVAKYGIIEGEQTFDIKPERIGIVTAIDAGNPLSFTDANIDFDLNETDENGTVILIQDVPAKITFNTGQLAGYTFELKKNGYNTATKTFEVLQNSDEKDLDVPSELLRPAIGDKYVITNIAMPASYITAAEAKLQAKAQTYLDDNSDQRNVYAVVPDPFYFEAQNVNISLGKTVHTIDADFTLDANLRVISLVKDLQNPFDVSFSLAERATLAAIVRDYIKAEKERTATKKSQRYNTAAALRNYKFAQEQNANIFDNEGYFDAEKIKPLSIETSQISLGSRLQQFSLPGVILQLKNNETELHNTGGSIVHTTIQDTPRTWTIAPNFQTLLTTDYHYLYVKAQKVGGNASILASTAQIMVDEDADFYHFLAGNVSSIIDGFRRVKTNYGYAYINPAELGIGRISSPAGGSYIDFKEDGIEMNAKVTFATGSPAIQQVSDSIEIGGRNLVRDSKFYTNKWLINLSGTKTVLGERLKVTFPTTSSTPGIYSDKTLSLPEGDYVARIKMDRDNFNASKVLKLWLIGSSATVNYVIPKESGDTIAEVIFNVPASQANLTREVYILSESSDEGDYILFDWIKLEKGNKATDWTPAPEDVTAEISEAKDEAESAAADYAEAKADLAELNAKAYADGEVSAEEAARIAEAAAKLQLAKDYADAQDGLQETLIKAYADGEISTAEANAIAVAEAKADLAELNAKAYADGEVSAEEAARIAEAAAKLQLAKDYADAQDGSIEIGGRNLVRDSKFYTNKWLINLSGTKTVLGERLKVTFPTTSSTPGIYSDKTLSLPEGDYVARIKMDRDNFNASKVLKLWLIGSSATVNYVIPKESGDTIAEVIFNVPASQANLTREVYILSESSDEGDYILFDWIKLEKGNKATDWTPAPEDVTAEISEAVQDLQDEVEGSFKDGIIEESEAIAIEKYLNAISNEKSTVDKEYTEIYANSSLTGTPKSDLNNYYTLFSTAYGNLVTSINSAIADGKTTVAEKNDVDAKFALFEVAKANYVEYYQAALEAIRQKNITDTKAYGDDEFGYLKTAAANNTRLEGGLLFSTLVKLGAIDSGGTWNENAGMSGLTSDNIGFYAGGTYAQALSDAAKIILRKDGSGQFAGGNFLFDTLGSVILKGLIEAVSGKIGAFDISADGISTDGIILDTSDLDALASIGGSVTSITVPSSATENLSNVALGVESVSVALVESISVSNASYLKFGVTNTIANIDTSSSLMQIKNATDDVVFSDLIAINDVKEYNVKLPSGTYEITFTTRGFPTDAFNTNNNSITAIAGETKILVEPISEMIKFSKNGGYMYFGTDKYFYFEKTHGLQVRLGSFVFKISSASGIQKSTNGGSSWTTI